jgi:hypothetical protein
MNDSFRLRTQRIAWLIALLAVVRCGQPAAANPESLELVQTIPLKGTAGRFDHLALDAKGDRLFIANLSNNSLDVVDQADETSPELRVFQANP